MTDLNHLYDEKTVEALTEELDKLLSEGEKTLATAIVRNTEKEFKHAIEVLARVVVKRLFWTHVAQFSDDSLSKAEDMIQAREKALNAVKNMLGSAANESTMRGIMGTFQKELKARMIETEKEAKKSKYYNMGF